VSLSDLLVVSVVAGICRNPLVRDAYSIPDGIAVVAVVLAWSYALDWLSYHSSFAHKLVHPKPVLLIRDGRVLTDNLRRELMTESQLRAQLRKHGIQDPGQVAEAILESSGQVSVIKKPSESPGKLERTGGETVISSQSPQESGFCEIVPSRPDGNRCSGAAAGPDLDASELRQATGRLREFLAWHERQIATHQHALTEIKKLQQAPGVRGATGQKP
jgi:hypothetical protein